MITSGIYNYVNILDKAADAANLRNELLSLKMCLRAN